MVGMQLEAVAQADVPHAIDSMSSTPSMHQFFVTHGRLARAYSSDLKEGQTHKLPIKAPCGKNECRKDEKCRCALHQTTSSLERLPSRSESRRRDDHGEHSTHYDHDDRHGEHDHEYESDRSYEQYAVGCVSGGQQWASILSSHFEEQVCHTESASSAGQSMMITASDQYFGHFYYAKPSTREVCAIKNHALCRTTDRCEPHVCVELHSEIASLAAIGSGRRSEERDERSHRPDFGFGEQPHLAVGLANGQVAFLRDMRLVNTYAPPDCTCVDCSPVVPIDISYIQFHSWTCAYSVQAEPPSQLCECHFVRVE